MDNPVKPLLIFDGDCGFCRRWIERWRKATRDHVDYEPYQTALTRFPEITADECRASVKLVEPGGKISSGAEAVLRSLAAAPGLGAPLWIYKNVPGFSLLAEAFYSAVARNRGLFRKNG